jgi:hypothetical protein
MTNLVVVRPLAGSGTTGSPLNLVYNTDFNLTTTNTPGGSTGLGLNLDSTLIVSPSISSTWSYHKSDGTSTFGPYIISGSSIGASSNSNTVYAPVGCKLSYNGSATIPAAGSGYSNPTSIAGNYVFSPDPPVTYPASGTTSSSGISSSTSYSITLRKPKTGLIVVGTQVTRASGSDSSSAVASVIFQDLFYYGYLQVGPTSLPISQTDVNAVSSAQVQGLGHYNFGGKSQSFTVNDGATGLGAGWRVVFAYPSTYGSLSSLTVTGSTINQLGAFVQVSSPINIITLSGSSISYTFYVAVADHSWNSVITTS